MLENNPQRPSQLPRKQHQRIICSSQYRQKLVRAPNYSYARRPTCFHKTERETQIPTRCLEWCCTRAPQLEDETAKETENLRMRNYSAHPHTPACMNKLLSINAKEAFFHVACNQKLLYAWTWSEWLYGQWQCAGEPIGSCGRCFICFRPEFFYRWFLTAGKFHQQSTHTVSDVWVVSPLVLVLQLPVSQCLDDVVTFLNSYLLLSHDNHVAVCLCHQAGR